MVEFDNISASSVWQETNSSTMRIQSKLLLLTIFWTLALVGNLLALGYLARTIPRELRQAENVTIRQQRAALSMRAELRDAEAALYRYLMEGEKGFIDQFDQHLTGFEEALDVYGSLGGDDEREWVDTLKNDYQSAETIGRALILLRDRQQEDFAKIENREYATQVLLEQIADQTQDRSASYQRTINDLRISLQEMQSAVNAYMGSPTPEDRMHFTDAAVRFYEAEQKFKSQAKTFRDEEWSRNIEENFSQIQGLGLTLISEREQQMAQFARFAAILFSMGQETLEKKVQPASEQKLIATWRLMTTKVRLSMLSSLVLAVSMFFLALIVTVPLVRQINTGIQALLAGADRVAAGQLSEPVVVQGSRELKKLATTFNEMMHDLAIRENRLKARISELEGLRQISLELTQTSDLDRIFQTIVESAIKLANACEVHIFICEDGDLNSSLQFAASAWKEDAQKRIQRAPRPNGVVMKAARQGRALVINHADQHPLFNSAETHAWGVRAVAALPLLANEKVVGVLNVIVRTRSVISKDELRILELLGDQAAVAIESARLYEAVADREMRLQRLVQKLAHIQEEERRLIGLDLHDGLTQLLISANMHFNTLEAYIDEFPEPARSEFALGHRRLQSAIVEARRVITELRPTVIETLGLIDGLRQYTANISQAEKWQLEYIVDVPENLHIPQDIETAIFRIAQEALANARKHAQTDHIRLKLYADEEALVMEVRDWGRGFDMSQMKDEKNRLGLVGMQERSALLNGQFEIHSAPDAGTVIRVRIPLITDTSRMELQ